MRSNASHVPFVSSAVSQKAAAMALYNITPHMLACGGLIYQSAL